MQQGMQIYWPPFTPTMKKIMYITCGAFLAQYIFPVVFKMPFTALFALTPKLFFENFFLWQIVTYIFLHGGILHLIFNMFAVWMFGGEIEKYWGAKKFITFFLLAGVFSGLISIVSYYNLNPSIVGASGSVYALLVAYGFMFPNRKLLFFGIFPMKTKYFVMLICLITFFIALSGGGNIAHFAHIGGIIFGLLYMRISQWKMLLGSYKNIKKQTERDRLKSRFKIITDDMTKNELQKFLDKHKNDYDSWN